LVEVITEISSGRRYRGKKHLTEIMSTASNTPPEGYFNDLSRSTGNEGRDNRNQSPSWEGNGAPDGTNRGDGAVPKPKRIACVICRKRKLKCDGSKPSCSTCTRLGHSCAYDEVRRKSGPKRGYVKALEERLSKSSQGRLEIS
jgi:hypothetical protein